MPALSTARSQPGMPARLPASPAHRELAELGPQLEALSTAIATELSQLSGNKRAALLQQLHGALFLLQLLCPAFGLPARLCTPAVHSLARGVGAMLASSAAVLSAPRQAGEQAEQLLRPALHASVRAQLDRMGSIVWGCLDLDKFSFRQPLASTALAAHALNDSSGLSWVSAVTAVLASSSDSGGGSSSLALNLPTADGLATPLALPQATALHRAVQSDRPLQQRLLQLLLPAVVNPASAAEERRVRPATLRTCVAVLVDLAPHAVAAHMATPAGLRSLQGASQQLLQLQQEVREQQRRQQRQAAADGQQAGERDQPQVSTAQSSDYRSTFRLLARMRLFAALAAAALQAPGSSSERAAVVRRILDDTLPAVVTAVQVAAKALPQVRNQEAWNHAGQALTALAQVLDVAAQQSGRLPQRAFDSAAAAMLAALQLRALLSGLEESWRMWRQQLAAGEPADPTAMESMAGAADAAEV